MARYKNSEWELPGPKIGTWEQVQVAVLMDIRDALFTQNAELRQLNALLHCRNFIGMPADLRQINKRMKEIQKLPVGRPKK